MFDSKPLEFLKGTIRNPAAVGSIIPSSQYLAREFSRGIDMGEESVVVELGPGTGPVTEHLNEVMPDPSRYVGIETDPGYVRVLKERFPQMTFFQGSAADSLDYLKEAGFEPEDVQLVASCLPFATLPEPVQLEIYEDIDAMMTPGTWFRTIQLAHAWPMAQAERFRARMDERFGGVDRGRLVWRNIPPAFVLTWTQ